MAARNTSTLCSLAVIAVPLGVAYLFSDPFALWEKPAAANVVPNPPVAVEPKIDSRCPDEENPARGTVARTRDVRCPTRK
jgi:hypothetical protein